MTPVIRIGLVADDLTGACDSALPFVAGGRVLVGLWPHVPAGDLACAAVSTESRNEPELAHVRGRIGAASLRCDLLFRKLDSMLRGSPVADLESALSAVGGRCLVAPALPGEGRTTAGGVQRWPGGEADLWALLAPLLVAEPMVELRDARTDADLDGVAREALARGDRVLAGSAGLAAALARALGLGPPPPAPAQACVRPLAVVGSPSAAAQADCARAHGWAVQVLGPGGLAELEGHDGLLLTGGETAARVLGHEGAELLELLGEALPRAPLARVRGGRLDGLPVVLKAGAFGPDDAIHRALEALHAQP